MWVFDIVFVGMCEKGIRYLLELCEDQNFVNGNPITCNIILEGHNCVIGQITFTKDDIKVVSKDDIDKINKNTNILNEKYIYYYEKKPPMRIDKPITNFKIPCVNKSFLDFTNEVNTFFKNNPNLKPEYKLHTLKSKDSNVIFKLYETNSNTITHFRGTSIMLCKTSGQKIRDFYNKTNTKKDTIDMCNIPESTPVGYTIDKNNSYDPYRPKPGGRKRHTKYAAKHSKRRNPRRTRRHRHRR